MSPSAVGDVVKGTVARVDGSIKAGDERAHEDDVRARRRKVQRRLSNAVLPQHGVVRVAAPSARTLDQQGCQLHVPRLARQVDTALSRERRARHGARALVEEESRHLHL